MAAGLGARAEITFVPIEESALLGESGEKLAKPRCILATVLGNSLELLLLESSVKSVGEGLRQRGVRP